MGLGLMGKLSRAWVSAWYGAWVGAWYGAWVDAWYGIIPFNFQIVQ